MNTNTAPDMVLARSEIKEITGRATRKTVCACLKAMGVHFVLGVDGWPRVGREHMNEILSGKSERRRTRPIFENSGA